MTEVLLASRTFLPEVNAAAFRLGALVEGLGRAQCDVDVVTSIPASGALPELPDEKVRLRRWPVLRDRGGNVRGYVQYASYDLPLFLRVILRRFDIAVAEAPPTTGLIVAMVAALHHRPFVYYAADVWTDGVAAVGSPKLVVAIMRVMERAVLRRARRVLSVSPGVTERLVALGAERERIVDVGHGIDTSVFAPEVPPEGEDEDYFVYTGTMSEVHSPEVFVEAFAMLADEHPTVRLRFFGQGTHEPALRTLAERIAPGRVHFGGVVPPERAAGWIRGSVAALVSLRPGLGYDYAHPTKAYAAAACGTPVLYTGAAPFGEIISRARLGQAVPFRAEAVADAMRRLLQDQASGATAAERRRRAAWAKENVSLDAVGTRAAAAVISAAG